MARIIYHKGDVLQEFEESRILIHVVNSVGGFGKGFAYFLAKKYPLVKKSYKDWFHTSALGGSLDGIEFLLGNVQVVTISETLTVGNMLAQEGYKTIANPKPLSYFALQECLKKVADQALETERAVYLPKIGTGLAGGEWHLIEKLIDQHLCEKGITVHCFVL